MKREKIYAMFKKRRHLNLFNKIYEDNGETKIALQYLCDGRACYALENLPLFDDETIFGLLGSKTNSELKCYVDVAPEWLKTALEDYDASDIPLTRTADMFGYTVLETHHNNDNDGFSEICIFVSPELLSPVFDEDYELVSRDVGELGRLIIVKAGLITKAVIAPYRFSEYDCNKNLKTVERAYDELRNLRNRYNKSKSDESDADITL